MGVAMFSTTSTYNFNPDLMEWLCLVPNKEKEVIENWVCSEYPSLMPQVQT